MRLDEITGDPKFDKMMKNIGSDMPRDMSNDGICYAIHPTRDDIAISITDVDSADAFLYLWAKNADDDMQAEFGYDSPLCLDEDTGEAIEHNDALLKAQHGIKQIVPMTFDEYYTLVERNIGNR
jgi:hypothetical protein